MFRFRSAKGHTRAEFTTNIKSWYCGVIEIPCSQDLHSCQLHESRVAASWSMWEDGQLVAHGDLEPPRDSPRTRGLGHFKSDPGHYALNLDVLTDESALNAAQPRLLIYESGGGYFESLAQGAYAFLMSLLCVPVGACVLILAAMHRRRRFGKISITQAGPPASWLP
jgi:hypothetical protein